VSQQRPDPMGEDLGETVRNMLAPGLAELQRAAALNTQAAAFGRIPPEHACYHLCSVFEPHACDGWAAEGVTLEVPRTGWNGKPKEPIKAQVCRPCATAPVRES
jgi:hypothetical protein